MAKHHLIILLLCILATFRTAAQIRGCPDRLAINYNPSATVNDGNCGLIRQPQPDASRSLPVEIAETSGLLLERFAWTHNDNNDTNLYTLDTVYGNIADIYPLRNVKKYRLEEISQDVANIYIGDLATIMNPYGASYTEEQQSSMAEMRLRSTHSIFHSISSVSRNEQQY